MSENPDSKSKSIDRCDLCELNNPVKPQLYTHEGVEKRFCCIGCKQVYIILIESGIPEADFKSSPVFQSSLQSGIISQVASKSPDGLESELDPESTIESNSTESEFNKARFSGEIKQLDLQVSGMWCSACSWLIEKVVRQSDGVVDARVIFTTDSVRVSYAPQQVSRQTIIDQINNLGYNASDRTEESDQNRSEKSSLMLRMGIAIFIAVNIMMMNSVIYIGYFQQVSSEISGIISLILWIFATPSVFWCGYPIHKKGLKSLVHGSYTMELLLSLGILTAYFYSVYLHFQSDPHIYFDTAANLVALVMLGKYFETAARHRMSDGLNRLYRMLPKKVRLKQQDSERLVSIDMLKQGDQFIVKPGEKIPADGIIRSGKTTVDESLLTGESTPVSRGSGHPVVGSSLNINGHIVVEATKIGKNSTLAEIIQLVADAFLPKSDIERLVDRISRWFIPSVILIALSTALLLIFSGKGSEIAILRGLTVLVIACPCSLGIATPLAITAGIGYAARRGILVKDGTVFGQLSKLNHLFLDKTGTLTEGNFTLLHHLSTSRSDDASRSLLGRIAAMEEQSSHPIAAAILAYCQNKKIPSNEVDEIDFIDGRGLIGHFDRRQLLVGNRILMKENGISLDEALDNAAQSHEQQGNSAVFYHDNTNQISGLFILGDSVKAGARKTLEQIQNKDILIEVLSGDSIRTTRAICANLGISKFSGQLTPRQKAEYINGVIKKDYITAMVGDGINDAPALATADVGIAIGSGTEIAIESADIVLLNQKIDRIRECIDISRRASRTIKQNLAWAFLYNIVGIFLAVFGYLNPLIAAVAMLISSISVVANSMRLHSGPNQLGKTLREIFLPWIERNAGNA